MYGITNLNNIRLSFKNIQKGQITFELSDDQINIRSIDFNKFQKVQIYFELNEDKINI